MQPGGKEQAYIPGRPTSPFVAAPQSSTSLKSSGPVVVMDGSSFSQAPPLSSSGPVVDLRALGAPQTTTPFLSPEQSQAHRFYPVAQSLYPLRPPPTSQPYMPPPTGSYHPQSQVPVVPMGPPPQGTSQLTSISNLPQPSESLFNVPRTPPQQSLHGYSNVLPTANVPPSLPGSQFIASRSGSQAAMQVFPAAHGPVHSSPYNAQQILFHYHLQLEVLWDIV